MKLTFETNKSADFIFDYLSDMQKYVSVHPVITKIKPLGGDTYKVFETLRFFFIPFSFKYFVAVSSAEKNEVVISATVMRFIHIRMVFKITSNGENSRIDEEITFKTKLPIKSMMGRIFKKQHAQLFKNIEAL